jgi:hypothetical protein
MASGYYVFWSIDAHSVESVQCARRFLFQPPAIGRDRQLNRRVAQLLLHVNWADPIGQQDGRIGVAQTVRREVNGQLGLLSIRATWRGAHWTGRAAFPLL